MARQLFQYHPTIGYHFVPGLQARVDHEGGGYLFRTNGQGFRCRHEFRPTRLDDRFRVLLFGDSYTAGEGVSDPKRYGDVLETLLPGAEVYNLAMPGTGTDQQYLTWREIGSKLDHDLVVIGVLVENIRRIVSRYRPFRTAAGDDLVLAKPYFTLEGDELTAHHIPVPREPIATEGLGEGELAAVDRGGRLEWLRNSVNRLGPSVKAIAQRISRYQPLPAYDRADSADWRLMEAILRRWIGEIEAPVVIVPIPLYQYIEETASPAAYQERFQTLADPPRVTIHDPLPDLLEYGPAERRAFRFEVDCHLTPPAHRALAESLARKIAPMLEQRAA
jgi:lysophospholipase L1-like esterase